MVDVCMRTFVFLCGQFQSPAAFPRLVQDFSGLRLLVVQDFSGLPLRVVVFFMNLLHGKSRLWRQYCINSLTKRACCPEQHPADRFTTHFHFRVSSWPWM